VDYHNHITGSLCFAPLSFSSPWQYMPLLNLCPLIFGFNALWLAALYYANPSPIHHFLWKSHFWFTPTFSGTQLGHKTRTWCTRGDYLHNEWFTHSCIIVNALWDDHMTDSVWVCVCTDIKKS
jgi:hypothetical protein